MLIDTHCHMNIMIRGYKTKANYIEFTHQEIADLQSIIDQAQLNEVKTIINVGTDLIESITCVKIAQIFNPCYAIIGIHPHDVTENWKSDFDQIKTMAINKEAYKIVGIGECGIDLHYDNYNLKRQQDAFKAQIELALQHHLPLSIHSRDAADETFKIIDQYAKESNFKGVMHCYSYDQGYAQQAITFKLALGIGGTITYPKNDILRAITTSVDIKHIILETDAPFLPPQNIRGKQNNPAQINTIAHYIAELKQCTWQEIAHKTTLNSYKLFNIHDTIL